MIHNPQVGDKVVVYYPDEWVRVYKLQHVQNIVCIINEVGFTYVEVYPIKWGDLQIQPNTWSIKCENLIPYEDGDADAF